MRRRLTYLLVWTLATTATVSASWLGVRSVLATAAPDRAQPLSAAELRQAAPPPLTPPRPAPTANSESWQGVSDGHGGTGYRRVFRLQGGTITVYVAAGDVRVVDVRPASGYAPTETRTDPQTVLVSLTSARHTSRLLATWRGGPYAEVTESV